MNRKKVKLFTFVAVSLLVLSAVWIPLRNSWYSCDVRYDDAQLYFQGGYRGVNTVKFFQLATLHDSPNPSLFLHIGDNVLKIDEITLKTMETVGAKRESLAFYNDWVIHWPSAKTSECLLRFEFEDEVFKGIELDIEPNAKSDNCPFGISRDGKEIIKLPITLRELKEIIGKPDLFHRSLRFP